MEGKKAFSIPVASNTLSKCVLREEGRREGGSRREQGQREERWKMEEARVKEEWEGEAGIWRRKEGGGRRDGWGRGKGKRERGREGRRAEQRQREEGAGTGAVAGAQLSRAAQRSEQGQGCPLVLGAPAETVRAQVLVLGKSADPSQLLASALSRTEHT